MESNDNIVYRLVKVSTIILLIGKGFLHFTSAQPYHLLFENDQAVTSVFGAVLIVSGIVLFFPERIISGTKIVYILLGSAAIILIHTLCSFKAVEYLPEQIIEHSLQIFLPLIFLFLFRHRKIKRYRLDQILTFSVALTFIGHGIYAIGVHGVPSHFIVMTNNCLKFDSQQSLNFLLIIGILDIVLATFLFIPKLRVVALWYMILWGILTSIARTYYVLGDEITTQFWLENLPNTVYRLPHGLIPLAILLKQNQPGNPEKYGTRIFFIPKANVA